MGDGSSVVEAMEPSRYFQEVEGPNACGLCQSPLQPDTKQSIILNRLMSYHDASMNSLKKPINVANLFWGSSISQWRWSHFCILLAFRNIV
jgi:hypothetical protein